MTVNSASADITPCDEWRRSGNCAELITTGITWMTLPPIRIMGV